MALGVSRLSYSIQPQTSRFSEHTLHVTSSVSRNMANLMRSIGIITSTSQELLTKTTMVVVAQS